MLTVFNRRASAMIVPVIGDAMRIILLLALFAIASPAWAAALFRDPVYAGGVALDFDTLPQGPAGQPFWSEVERQSRACAVTAKSPIPCVLLWSQAMGKVAQDRKLRMTDYADLRKTGSAQALPEHFYADILPALVKHVQYSYPAAIAMYDSSKPMETVLHWAMQWCDTPARCDGYATVLRDVTKYMRQEPSRYNVDYFDLIRILLALRTWQDGPEKPLPLSLAYLRAPGTERCDLCLEHVARDFARRGRPADAARIERYRADLKLKPGEDASALELRSQEENLLEAEQLFLPAGHVRLFERQVRILKHEWAAVGDVPRIADRFRALCPTASAVFDVRREYLAQLDALRQECNKYLATVIYNIGAIRGDIAMKDEAYAIALKVLGITEDTLTVDNWPASIGDSYAGLVVIDGLGRRNFALADKLLDRQLGTDYQFHASVRYRNGYRDLKTRWLLLQEVNCTVQRHICYGKSGYLERGESTDKPFRPYALTGDPLDSYAVQMRDFSFKRLVRIDWELAHAAKPR